MRFWKADLSPVGNLEMFSFRSVGCRVLQHPYILCVFMMEHIQEGEIPKENLELYGKCSFKRELSWRATLAVR